MHSHICLYVHSHSKTGRGVRRGAEIAEKLRRTPLLRPQRPEVSERRDLRAAEIAEKT